jgi:hypothetical protein
MFALRAGLLDDADEPGTLYGNYELPGLGGQAERGRIPEQAI